jgi:hypothetical protein
MGMIHVLAASLGSALLSVANGKQLLLERLLFCYLTCKTASYDSEITFISSVNEIIIAGVFAHL